GKTRGGVGGAWRGAVYQLRFLDRVPDYAAVDDAVNASRAAAGAKLAGFANAVLRKIVASGEPALPAEGRARLEIEHSMPAWIIDELARLAGDRLAELVAAMNQPAPLVGRANLRRTSRDALLAKPRAAGATAETIAL